MEQARGATFGETLVEAACEDADAGRAALRAHERRAWLVALINLAVMAAELAGGAWFNSLALQSDGLHSGAHAGVLLIAACAYVVSRRRRFTRERTARTLDVAALGSGVLLGVAGLSLGVESVGRLISPEPVRFGEAAALTALSLLVSGVSAGLLRGAHGVAHLGGRDGHAHGRDLNLWAAYLHMLADVVTSVLALAALLLGLATGWGRLDPLVGCLNALVVAVFAVRLLTASAGALARRPEARDL